jgi:hypothetical protein
MVKYCQDKPKDSPDTQKKNCMVLGHLRMKLFQYLEGLISMTHTVHVNMYLTYPFDISIYNFQMDIHSMYLVEASIHTVKNIEIRCH